MGRLLVCSEADPPSVNMADSLIGSGGWEDMGADGGLRFLSKGETFMVRIPDMHIRHDDLDVEAEAFGIKVDDVIVMSKHSSSSGTPSLTAHPIGNPHENDFGGRAETFVKASPALMTDALRKIVAYNDVPGTQTCFEVTHHGPWLDRPTFYIEIGSDDSQWHDRHKADILARVITDLEPDYDAPVVIGVGGGHYAPRFSEMVLKKRVSFGHMIPNYQLEGRDDDDIVRMLRDAAAASGTNVVYLHRKSMKKPVENRLSELIASAGLERAGTDDFDDLSASRRRSRRSPCRGSPSGARRGSFRRPSGYRCGSPSRSSRPTGRIRSSGTRRAPCRRCSAVPLSSCGESPSHRDPCEGPRCRRRRRTSR
ncbi:MAG: D-aminoacyl-tRNA deacylase [Candidatus Methanomethylophilaceae archaeon]|nr:D-aminoacyl-tRNA deacylase [Candidatus Methanomethylophilaceae archaeon]